MKLNELYKAIEMGAEKKITPEIAVMQRVSIRRTWAQPGTADEWLIKCDFGSGRGLNDYRHAIITMIYDEIVKLYVEGQTKLLTDSDYVLRIEGIDIDGDLHIWDIWSF